MDRIDYLLDSTWRSIKDAFGPEVTSREVANALRFQSKFFIGNAEDFFTLFIIQVFEFRRRHPDTRLNGREVRRAADRARYHATKGLIRTNEVPLNETSYSQTGKKDKTAQFELIEFFKEFIASDCSSLEMVVFELLINGFSSSEMASKLGTTESNARKIKERLVAKLRKKWRESNA